MTDDEVNEVYSGMSAADIQELEKRRLEERLPEIDKAHAGFTGKFQNGRKGMLTVGRLVEWLKTRDQNACVLAYELNSDAYIEQLPDLPSGDICGVEDARADMEKSLRSWYKGQADADDKIKKELDTVFRYAEPGDIVIKFG